MRAVRGAIQVDADDHDQIISAAAEMVGAVLEHNGLTTDNLISVVFTATPDLTAEFPAYGARNAGIVDVPLLCAQEIPVPGAMPRRCAPTCRTDRCPSPESASSEPV